jgi:uncharacterized small protein (DUF1192 family)
VPQVSVATVIRLEPATAAGKEHSALRLFCDFLRPRYGSGHCEARLCLLRNELGRFRASRAEKGEALARRVLARFPRLSRKRTFTRAAGVSHSTPASAVCS